MSDATALPLPLDTNTSLIDGENSNKENVVQFWIIFRNVCNAFHNRIDTLLLLDRAGDDGESTRLKDTQNQVRNHYATASKRNEGRVELDSIMRELRVLQHFVLSSSSSLAVDSSTDTKNESLDELLSQPIPDLALTDIRLLTAEMEKILQRIDYAKEMICPKEKFVFRRYRKALEELNRNNLGEIASAVEDAKFREDSKQQDVKMGRDHQPKSHELNYGGVFENKSDSIIKILHDGSIVQNGNNEAQEHWNPYSIPQLNECCSTGSTGTSSYLLQDLNNSTIIIQTALQSLHIQNINNCKIYSSVLGPVHVTNCKNSEIRCSAYQLRIHDSKNVRFGVWVRSGPIIEDCSGIVFAGDFYRTENCPGRNMYWDVKDFNWLRSLKKSPNFTVIEITKDNEGGGANAKNLAGIADKSTANEVDSEDEL
eukprot:scaffold1351_cov57-Cyclotella_meneghiniana.AAC.4